MGECEGAAWELDCRIDLQGAPIKDNKSTWFQADVTQDGFAMIFENGECNGVGARSANFLRDKEKGHNSMNRLGSVFVNRIVQVVLLNGAWLDKQQLEGLLVCFDEGVYLILKLNKLRELLGLL
jgi:hypothetical protein